MPPWRAPSSAACCSPPRRRSWWCPTSLRCCASAMTARRHMASLRRFRNERPRSAACVEDIARATPGAAAMARNSATAAAEQQGTYAPRVRVERVTQRQGRMHLSLPGTTLAFEQADIFARTTGYVLKRYVDIGDRVKAGQLLAEITAPEVDDQIAQ